MICKICHKYLDKHEEYWAIRWSKDICQSCNRMIVEKKLNKVKEKLWIEEQKNKKWRATDVAGEYEEA